MKRLLFLLVFFSVDVISMHSAMRRSAQRSTPRNVRTCLNIPSNFGKTHFIRGYRQSSVQSICPIENQSIVFDQRQPIIDGSSAHLIDEQRLTQSFSTIKHNISSIVLTILATGQKKITIAAFNLTDDRIVKQLIHAHKKGIEVCVIMDGGNMKHSHSKSQKLIDNGIAVWRYEPSLRLNSQKKNGYEPLMHLKWIIVDNILINGSANFTRSAQDGRNIESITIFRCPREVKEHRQTLEELKKYCIECKAIQSV